MTTLAILPVKSFARGKDRLQDELTPRPRRALAEAMFSDVLVALRRARMVDRILVVSTDPGAQQIAGGHGAQVLDDDEQGQSAAAAVGVRAALASGADRTLLVPGDCPLLDPAEVDWLIAREASARSALIVPDRHGTGTNALLLTPPDSLAPLFGPDSRARHVSSAQSAGTTHEVVEVPSLGLDIDTPDDLALLRSTLAAKHGGAAHTRGMLSQQMRSRL